MAFDPSVRKWQNDFQKKYGEAPNTTSDPTFNYRAAFAANDGPKPYANDTIPHWGSAGKAENHPTEWMQKYFEQNNGADVNDDARRGFSPIQSSFVNNQMRSDLRTQDVQRLLEGQ